MSNDKIRTIDLHALPPTIDVETAGRILGIGRALAYRLAKRGEFPCRVVRAGRRYLVPRAELLRVLGVDERTGPHPDEAPSPPREGAKAVPRPRREVIPRDH